ncbi:MAG TPA: translation initiation factor [Rikenellaceae bacterium]|jgi:translation initiation factor 1|nr:MAG: SUI1 family translation initiation factor [Bacteroidetes bacterium GWE2_40_15]PKP07194.1 MAG: translation initiation factor [Bacteroidetes bacterium HGW-Bacteroidetes-5]HBZ26743.1 translation initiation factor [Rikenellaceae bacterium]
MAENDWKSRLGVVFSTNPEFTYHNDDPQEQRESIPTSKQSLIVAIDRRNRGGKQVTLVTGFVGNEQELEELGRKVKTKCGTGGSVKDGEIIIQGDFRDRVVAYLLSLGYKAKRGN